MKGANCQMDFTPDKINIFGQEMNVTFTTSEHCSIPIRKTYETLKNLTKIIKNILLKRSSIKTKSGK